MTEPKTFPEMLDAAPDGETFGALILAAITELGKARDEEGNENET